MKQSILLLFFSAALNAQHLSYGLKAGAPLTDVVQGSGNVAASTTRLTIGPMLELRLPAGLAVEFDVLYKKFSATTGTAASQSAGSWDFPIVGKYKMPGIIARPYAEAGFDYNSLSSIATFNLKNRKGLILGAGIEISLPKIHIAPELRYTRYNQNVTLQTLIPNANQAEVLIGISF